MSGRGMRLALFGLALTVCLTCWAGTFGVLFVLGHPGAAAWTTMVTVSAIATEATIWTGAFTLGWSMFEKRRRLWLWVTARVGGLV